MSGAAHAQHRVGELFQSAGKRNKTALTQLRTLAETGDPDAQQGLASLYNLGNGVPKDAAEASICPEELLYVQFAASLDDGEASSLALCVAHSYAFATDDRKARRIAGEQPIPVWLVATSDLMLNWMRETGASRDKVRSALLAITTRARFTPWKGYPEQLWWKSMTD